MKITKFTHSCLLVEMPEPVNRTALFDPGTMSTPLLKDHNFEYLDDIVITHSHPDHMDVDFIKSLSEKFPEVRITAPSDCLDQLHEAGLTQATDQLPDGLVPFDAPHENVEPLFPLPEEYGYHYLDLLTHPGDSHSFTETKAVLALPVTGPWGSNIKAVNLAIELKPKYVLPIHDWHWHDDARTGQYDAMADAFEKAGITFIKLNDGEPVVLEV